MTVNNDKEYKKYLEWYKMWYMGGDLSKTLSDEAQIPHIIDELRNKEDGLEVKFTLKHMETSEKELVGSIKNSIDACLNIMYEYCSDDSVEKISEKEHFTFSRQGLYLYITAKNRNSLAFLRIYKRILEKKPFK